jgi:hypothetical protein
MLLKPDGSEVKTRRNLTKQQAAMFWAFEQMLESMGLAYQLRCKRCNQRGDGNDGCWGNNLSTASQYVVECACTERVYQGADVPLH